MKMDGIFYWAFLLGAALVPILIVGAIVFYVLMSLGLYTMANNQDIEHAWLSWIPIAQVYIIGMLIRKIVIGGYEIPYTPFVLLGATILPLWLSEVAFLGPILFLAAAVLFLFAMYKLYDIYGGNPVFMLIVSIILPFMGPIFIFKLRNEEPEITQP
jgi:hypothetical protein